MTIPIYKPYLPKSALRYAHEALDSGWISSQGKYVGLIAEQLQDLLGVKYVLPLNNGTSGCHLVAKTAKRKTGKSEVIVPTNCYVAAINGFLFDGDWKLYSVKCDLATWNYDLDALDAAIVQHPEAVVLVVHNMGNVINVPELQRRYPDTVFVEDACEAFGGTYQEKWAGTEGLVNVFSGYSNKTICAGESGWLTTNDEEIFKLAKCFHAQGQSETRFVHQELGTNYRMTNVQAALLVGQLEVLPQIRQMKAQIFDRYRQALGGRTDVSIQQIAAGTTNANWMFGVRVLGQTDYSQADRFFAERGVEVRPMFYPITAHTYLRQLDEQGVIEIGDCSRAELLNRQCVILPSYPELGTEEQDRVLEVMDEYLEMIRKGMI